MNPLNLGPLLQPSQLDLLCRWVLCERLRQTFDWERLQFSSREEEIAPTFRLAAPIPHTYRPAAHRTVRNPRP